MAAQRLRPKFHPDYIHTLPSCRSPDEKTRCTALALLAAAVEGVGGNHRNALGVQQEAFRTAERLAKDRDSAAVRCGVCGCG